MEQKKILTPRAEVEVWADITSPYEGEDAQLHTEMRGFRMDYPFGSSALYPINPCTTLKELIAEVQRVFRSLWDAGLSDAPHEMEDFVIEVIIVNKKSVTVIIGS